MVDLLFEVCHQLFLMSLPWEGVHLVGLVVEPILVQIAVDLHFVRGWQLILFYSNLIEYFVLQKVLRRRPQVRVHFQHFLKYLNQLRARKAKNVFQLYLVGGLNLVVNL